MIDWRTWLYTKLSNDAAVTNLCGNRIYGGGSLVAAPATKPFIVITVSDEVPSIGDVVKRIATIWAHDDSGDYGRVDQVLSAVKAALPYQVVDQGGIACEWTGNSGDLANDTYGTITRNGAFNLLGRN